MAVARSSTQKLKKLKSIGQARLVILQTLNNCFTTLTTLTGDVIKIFSFGSVGIKSTQKGTLISYEILFDAMIKLINELGIYELSIKLVDMSLPSSIISKLETLLSRTKIIQIESIKNQRHGGCRLRKEKRK
jgi:ribosomal protein S11